MTRKVTVVSEGINGNFAKTISVAAYGHAISLQVRSPEYTAASMDEAANITHRAALELGTALIKASGLSTPVVQAAPAPKRSTPKGEQAYKGNGKHEWEQVTTNSDDVCSRSTYRLRVPGGWLYRTSGTGTVFVPVPDVVGYSI